MGLIHDQTLAQLHNYNSYGNGKVGMGLGYGHAWVWGMGLIDGVDT